MTEANAAVMAKISKLLALAKSANVNEAANAAAAAQRLMDEHRRAAADLAASTPTAAGGIGESSFDGRLDGKLVAWRCHLATVIANHNGAIILLRRGLLVIVGTPDDVGISRYLFDYLTREIDRLTASHARRKGRAYANSFRIGCVHTIKLRLDTERAKAVRASATTALVIAGADKARAWFERTANRKITTRAVGTTSDPTGLVAGMAAAHTITLTRGLAAPTGNNLRQLR